jgi:hypothetical protein
MTCHVILFVEDQQASTRFYTFVLDRPPDLNVPGMTEFHLGAQAVLGLMPMAGIRRLLGSALPDPSSARGIPRAEVYLKTEGAAKYHARALAGGARELDVMRLRDWGDLVAYSLDPDGHVLAFAEATPGENPDPTET